MLPGKKIKIGDREFVVPVLSFQGVRKLIRLLKDLGDLTGATELTEDQLDLIADIVLLGLARNYPELTREELEEHLDLNNFGEVLTIIVGQSGLKKNPARAVMAPSQ